MKNRFVKNLWQIIQFGGTISCFLVLFIVMFVMAIQQNPRVSVYVIFLTIIIGPVLLFFVIGGYWIFQTIEINEKGITVQWHKRVLREIPWGDIEEGSVRRIMGVMAFSFKVKSSIRLNLDMRKSIRKAIEYYAPNNLIEQINRKPNDGLP